MEQLTAKVLNNQIISMRKEVRKAVVHQIHGLTQKANKLRLKKGTEEQIKKNNLKADHFVSEIQVLKKLKPDNVSLFALSNPNDSDLRSLVSKPVISPEAKAMAKLCLRENMQKAVREFISAHNGSIEVLNDLISERYNKSEKQKKKKKAKKKKKRQNKELEGNAQKAEKKKVAKTEIPDDMSESSDSIPQLVPIPEKPEVLLSDDEPDLENESGNVSNASDMSGEDDELGEKSENEDSDDDDDDDNNDNHIQEKKTHQIISKDRQQINNRSSKKGNTPDQIKVSNQTVKRKRVDPFFKSSDDSDYFTFCDVGDNAEKNELNSNNNNNHFRPEKTEKGFFQRTTEFMNKNPFKKADKNVYQKNNDRSSFKRDFHDKRSFQKDFRGNSGHYYKSQLNRDVPNNRRQNNLKGTEHKQRNKELAGKFDDNVKLHPSWEAKKKLNIASLPFEGKKIVFDDD